MSSAYRTAPIASSISEFPSASPLASNHGGQSGWFPISGTSRSECSFEQTLYGFWMAPRTKKHSSTPCSRLVLDGYTGREWARWEAAPECAARSRKIVAPTPAQSAADPARLRTAGELQIPREETRQLHPTVCARSARSPIDLGTEQIAVECAACSLFPDSVGQIVR